MRSSLQARYVFTLMACLGNMISLLGRDSLRLAVLPMKEELNMTSEEVSHVLAGYNYGMTLTMLVGGPLSDILGGKWLLFLVTLISGLCTGLVPLMAPLAPLLVVVSQVVCGLAGGLVVPALGSMIARWEPLSQRGQLAAIIYSGSPASAVISSLLTGYLSFHYDWRITFYILASLPLLWALPWILLITDDPALSRLTSQSERSLLTEEIPASHLRPALRDIPVREMVTSGPVLAMVTANVAVIWATVHTSLLLPQYLNDVIGLPLHHNSLVSTLPFLGCCLVGLLSSLVSSWILKTGLSKTAARKVCSSICLLGFALLSLPVPFIQSSSSAVIVLTTAAFSLTGGERGHRETFIKIFTGFRYVGPWNNPLDLAPSFAGTLMGVSGLFCYLTAALVPHTTYIMASLVREENVWTGLFLLVSGSAVLANVVFLVLGTANLQGWNSVVQSGEKLREEEHPE